jgi:multiple sugar transport system permease protein
MLTIKRAKQSVIVVVFYLVLLILLLYFMFPIIWTILTSIKYRIDAFAMPPKWFFTPTLENYQIIFWKHTFIRYIFNSVSVGIISTGIAFALGLPAAYAFSRSRRKWSSLVSFLILGTRIVPPIILVLPFFMLFYQLKMVGARISVILLHCTFSVPFVIWLMKIFFDDVPRDFDDAALVDGCSRFYGFLRVILPLSKSGLSATVILCLIGSWNEFLFALILTNSRTRTLPVAATDFIQFTGTYWGPLCAAATVMILPLILFGFLVQRRLVAGLTFGAIKE